MWQYMTRELEHSTVWPCGGPQPHRNTLHPSLDPVECPCGPTEWTAACCQLRFFSLPSALGKNTRPSQPDNPGTAELCYDFFSYHARRNVLGFFPLYRFAVFSPRCVTGEYGCCFCPQLFLKALEFWSAAVIFTTVVCLWHLNMLFFLLEKS